MRNLAGQGDARWDAARQWAQAIATGGTSEPNVDPAERIRLEELARVAELHVGHATGLPTARAGGGLRVTAVSKRAWASSTLDAWRPLIAHLTDSLAASDSPESLSTPEFGEPPAGDPLAMFGPLLEAMMPMVAGMTAGSMVGNLAHRAFGPYVLPIPRPGDELGILVENVDRFGTDWSLPADDLRLWICLHEIAHHTVLGVAHVRRRLDTLLVGYLSSFERDTTSLEQRLGHLDPETFDLSQGPAALLGDPELLLGAIRSQAQLDLLPQLQSIVAVVVGCVDHFVEASGRGLLPSFDAIVEALHRHRVEASPADRFVEHLLGVELSPSTYERGQSFVAGVVERAGPEALARLWRSERELPTPAEVDAPGLWLARIDLPS